MLFNAKCYTSQMNKNQNPIDGTNMHKSGTLFVKIHESEIPIHKLEKIDCLYLIKPSYFFYLTSECYTIACSFLSFHRIFLQNHVKPD